MWRFLILAALGLVIGTRARSERGVLLVSLFFGVVYGGAAAVSAALATGSLSQERALYLMILGVVMAAPVYAVAEIWRRARTQVISRLRRLIRPRG
jgi:hypothetical protein